MAGGTLAIFDLDGTITRHDTLWPFISGFLLRHPSRWWRLPLCVAPLLRYALAGRDRGALKGSIIRLTLGGAPRAALERWAARFTQRLLRTGLYAEALTLIATHRRTQTHLVLLSASPDLYVPDIARALGFDECICTEVRWRGNGTLDGALASANRRGEEKARCVQAVLARLQPRLSQAYGNSRADLEHLRLVDAGTYVNGRSEEVLHTPSVHVVRWSTPGNEGTLAAIQGL
ncbi:MAG: HAD-IB family hydrolase [Proteobacteria bacterium]|nr:HAD-IB family hydrolase [Pseudomonadota bacterium]